MKTIKVLTCSCQEEVYEDDFSREIDGIEYLACINCGTEFPKSALIEQQLIEITHSPKNAAAHSIDVNGNCNRGCC